MGRVGKPLGFAIVVVALAAVVAACGGSSGSSSSGGGGSSSGNVPQFDVTTLTADFSQMAELKDLAAQGKGKIGVLLPDTTTSTRYVQYDAPYLKKAFEAAGLSSDDFKIDNAQGKASTMQQQAEADITEGASVAAGGHRSILSRRGRSTRFEFAPQTKRVSGAQTAVRGRFCRREPPAPAIG